mgnify:FL=1
MKAILKWLFKPTTPHYNQDFILHIEDDYYHQSYTPSRELSRYYLVQLWKKIINNQR